jgi:carbonic anhydrase
MLKYVSVPFQISNQDNMALKPVLDAISQVTEVTPKVAPVHTALNISALLPSNLALYRYYGSLTTPSCNEIVHWNVFRNTMPISRAQVSDQ